MPEPQVSSDTWTLQWQFHHNWLLPFVSCSPHGDTVLLTVWGFLCRLLWVALLAGLIVWLALDTGRNPEQLISLGGFCFLVLFLFACSKHHDAVCVSGVTWPSVPLQEVATQHWRISTSFPLASPSLEEAEAQQSWAELGTACGAELVGWVDPKATSLLFFALLSFPTQGSHTLPLSCFLPCPSWWVRPRSPAPDPHLSFRCCGWRVGLSFRCLGGLGQKLLKSQWLPAQTAAMLWAVPPSCSSKGLLNSQFQSSRSVLPVIIKSLCLSPGSDPGSAWQVMFQPVPESHQLISGSVTHPHLPVSVTLLSVSP